MESELIIWIYVISLVLYIAFILIASEIYRRKEKKAGDKMTKFIYIWTFIELILAFLFKIFVDF